MLSPSRGPCKAPVPESRRPSCNRNRAQKDPLPSGAFLHSRTPVFVPWLFCVLLLLLSSWPYAGERNRLKKTPLPIRETGFETCLTWSFDIRTLSLGVRINRLKQNRGFPLRKPLRTAYRTSWKRELRISPGWLFLFPLSPSVLFRQTLFPAEDGRKSCRSNLAVRTCSGRWR